MTGTTHAASRSGRFVRFAAIVAALCLAAYAAGFGIFLSEISRYRIVAPEDRADGIVVLTGGVARVDEGVKLLDGGKAKRLLISGVHPSASRAVLAKAFSVDKSSFECCVDIDHEAMDTVGNATETADWAAEHGYRSLLVVTNDYHMPRSLLELRSTMPGVALIPHAVVARQNSDTSTGDRADRYRVLLGEYAKYAAARIRTLVTPHLGNDEPVRRAALND